MHSHPRTVTPPGDVTLLKLLLLMAILIPAASPAADRALLVGIGHYPQLNQNLPGIASDLLKMQIAATQMGFAPRDIKVLRDEQATYENVKATFKSWLVDGANPADRRLFYFSGHGSYIPDTSGDESEGLDEVLVMYDSFRATPDNHATLENVLVDDEMARLLRLLPGRSNLVIVDACHSATSTRGLRRTSGASPAADTAMADIEYLPKALGYPGMPTSQFTDSFYEGEAASNPSAAATGKPAAEDNYVVMAAARDNQKAVVSVDGSVFTNVLTGILGNVLGGGGSISPDQLLQSTAQQMVQTLPQAISFEPQISGNSVARQAPISRPSPASFRPPVYAGNQTRPVKPSTTVTAVATAPVSRPSAPGPQSRPPAALASRPVSQAVSRPAPPPAPPPAPTRPPRQQRPAAPLPAIVLAPTPAPAITLGADSEWYQMLDLVKRSQSLPITTNQSTFKIGEPMRLAIEVPQKGYLNIVSIDAHDQATLLFPNKYDTDNLVQPGTFHLPTAEMRQPGPAGVSIELAAQEPLGRTLVLAFLSNRPVDLYAQARRGGLHDLSSAFAMVTPQATRSLRRSPLQANVVELTVCTPQNRCY